jgi:Cupin-like domain
MVSSCRFPALSEVCSREEYRLWIGAAGQRSTIHNDPYNNFNAQIAGRKYFLLFPPEEHRKLHARFFHEGMWASPIDPKRPDIVRFPEFADLRAYEHELSEGDILYIPRFWWHYVEGITPCVNVNRWIFSEATKGEWWHQQPSAKENIRFGELVEQISNEFLALPLELQEIRREDFEALRLELERFAKEQRMGTA